ncbi:MAG: flagellar export protein FliJ [Candidatus Scalindua sp.]|nr:flagellar export protein FliJ [Candidatus Scalindua sp.]
MAESAKFHFKLEPLLNKERIYEEECVVRLRAVQEIFLNEKIELENINKRKLASQSELASKKRLKITATELATYEDYFVNLAVSMDVSKSRIQEISIALNTVQEELIGIVKKRKGLEKLRDKWEEEHKEYLEHLSNKEMDDIGMIKFNNKLVDENGQD